MSETRCDWSDLPTDQCAHCGAAPGDRPRLDAPRPPRHATAPAVESVLNKPKLPSTWQPSNDAGECRCGQPTRDGAWMCDACEKRFADTLADLPDLAAEVDTTITRQRSATIEGGSRSATTSLPWHEAAADALRTLHGLLVQWVRFCAEENVRGPRLDFPGDRIGSLAGWLATRVHGLTLLDIGPEAMDEITDAAAECHRIVFWKRRNRLYLGPCRTRPEVEVDGMLTEGDPCPGEVYAEEDADVGFCDLCHQGATVVIRRAELEEALDAYLATASEIARIATYLGLEAPRDQVRKRVHYWHRHKRIEQRSTDHEGTPMFRYGEVRGMLYADFARRVS